MKILHIATGYPLSFPGGITNYVRSLAKIQVALGNEVHVLASPEKCQIEFPGIRLHSYAPSTVRAFSLRNIEHDPVAKQVSELIAAEQFDLIHFHMGLDLPLGFYEELSRSSTPYVVSLHDYYYICPRVVMVDYKGAVCRTVDKSRCRTCISALDQVDLLRRAFFKLGIALPRFPSSAAERRLAVMQRFLGNAKLLLPVSTRTGEIYREVVPGGRFAIEHIGNESALCERGEKTESDRIRAVFLGTLSRYKGAEVFGRIVQGVSRPDVEFHFYGRAFEGFEAKLRSQGVNCHGEYRPEDLPSIMYTTDLGFALSIWEDNGPQVAMEFINYGVPVIGTRRGGIPDFVVPGNGLLFDPDSDEDLQSVLNWINNVSPSDLRTMSAGMKRLQTPEGHAKHIQDLYVRALLRTLPSMVKNES